MRTELNLGDLLRMTKKASQVFQERMLEILVVYDDAHHQLWALTFHIM